MKLRITKEVARPKGHWQVMKWNLLKGESEDTAEVINKDNLITDYGISVLMRSARMSNRMWLQLSNEIPTVENTLATDLADTVQGGTTSTVYFFPSGAPVQQAGKEVKGIFNTDSTNANTHPITMWLRLDVPLLLEEGDVLKVSYTVNPDNLGTVTASGTIPYKTYAYGEDPADPNAGTLVENIDFTASYSFTQGGVTITQPILTPVKNPDGSMSYGTDMKFKYKSSVRAISDAAITISNVTCVVPINQYGVNRNLTVTFPNTKPVQEPGSYIEVEVDFNVKVLPNE